MNFSKPNIGVRENITLVPRKGQGWKALNWAISYRAVTPLAIIIDALIIFSTSMLSGIVYHLETIGLPGRMIQFGGFAAVVAALFITVGKSRNHYKLRSEEHTS